jgi:hypothetical protein
MAQSPYTAVNTDLGLISTLAGAGSGTVSVSPAGPPIYFTNSGNGRLDIRFYCSAVSGTSPTINLILQGYDVASGQFFTLGSTGAFTPVVGNLYRLTCSTGITAPGTTPNFGISSPMPPYWRVQYTIAGTSPIISGTIGAASLVA